MLDDRDDINDTEELIILPLNADHHAHNPNSSKKDKELEQSCEQIIVWLRCVTLTEQLRSSIDTQTVRAAIAKINTFVQRRLQASKSVIYKQTVNITTSPDITHPCGNAHIVSCAPELSLHLIGSFIPVVEVPDIPMLTLGELAYLLTVVGTMVEHLETPGKMFRNSTNAIPNIYRRGKDALDKTKAYLEFHTHYHGSGARGSQD